MFGFFGKKATFTTRKSLRDNFTAMCSLPLHKTRSKETQQLINRLSDRVLNYGSIVLTPSELQNTSPVLQSLLKLKNENIKAEKKDDTIILADFDAVQKIDEAKKERAHELDKEIVKVTAQLIVAKLLEAGTDLEETTKNVLHDLAFLEGAKQSLDGWHSARFSCSTWIPLVNQYKDKIVELQKQYDAVYENLLLKRIKVAKAEFEVLKKEVDSAECQQASQPKKKTKPKIFHAIFFKEPETDPFILHRNYFNSPKARLVEAECKLTRLRAEHADYFVHSVHTHDLRANKFAEVRRSYEPQTKQHWWNRLAFAVFTPFLNLLIDADSFNFFVDGINVFADLVR